MIDKNKQAGYSGGVKILVRPRPSMQSGIERGFVVSGLNYAPEMPRIVRCVGASRSVDTSRARSFLDAPETRQNSGGPTMSNPSDGGQITAQIANFKEDIRQLGNEISYMKGMNDSLFCELMDLRQRLVSVEGRKHERPTAPASGGNVVNFRDRQTNNGRKNK